jgi:histidinol-phosphate phosphatase family protein
MQAIIFTGTALPKLLTNVGGKPFIAYIINQLADFGVNDILILSANCLLNETVFRHYGNVKIIKDEKQLGSAGTIFNLWDILESDFFLLNGVTFFDADLNIMENFFKNLSVKALIALCYSQNPKKYGFINIDDTYAVTLFVRKEENNTIDGYINAGIYRLAKKALEPYFKSWDGREIYLETDIFFKMAEKKELYALPLGGYFIDLSFQKDCDAANDTLPRRMAEPSRNALFIDRDNVLIEDKGFTHGTELVYLPKAEKYLNHAVKNNMFIIVVSNQSGVARGYFTEDDVIVTNRAVDRYYSSIGIEIDDFIYCPYYSGGVVERYAHKSLLRKPQPGMILKACEKYRIDLANSLMLGDNPKADIIALPYLKCEII